MRFISWAYNLDSLDTLECWYDSDKTRSRKDSYETFFWIPPGLPESQSNQTSPRDFRCLMDSSG